MAWRVKGGRLWGRGMRIARARCALAMTGGCKGTVGRRREGTPPYGGVTRSAVGRAVGDAGPYGELQEVQWAGDRKGRPYGSVTRSAVRRDDVGIGPYGCFLQIKKENAGGVLLTA